MATGSKPKAQLDGVYADPIYKKLSKINGEINKLSKNQLQSRLKEFGIEYRGVKEVLRKRLKNHYKRKKLGKANIKAPVRSKFDYFAVIDFEATCDENNSSYRHEIIEFPIVLIDVETMEIVDKFQEYVRPLVNPKLSEFCTSLTGITQEVVDQADTFPDVLTKAEDWLYKHSEANERTFAVLTDGPWDMFRFMYYQCLESKLDMPKWSKKWINVRKSYCNFYSCGRGGIELMLKNLGMQFEGSPHSGIDDATNIARIALQMLRDGCTLNLNERIHIIYNPMESKNQCRYEPLQESEEDDDACEVDDDTVVFVDDNKDSGDARDKGFKELDDVKGNKGKKTNQCRKDLNSEMKNLSLSEAVEQQGDDVTDLLAYYKLQKS